MQFQRGNIGLFFKGDPTLKLWMPFEEGSGTSTRDLSGNGNNGTLNGGALFTPAKFDNALYFDGVNDYVDCGNGTSLQLTTGTVMAWIKTPNAGSNYRGIVVKQMAYGMFLYGNIFGIYDWGIATFRTTNTNLADNKWHYVAFSFQSGISNGTKLYIDGNWKIDTTMTISDQTVQLFIGKGIPTTGQEFSGLIDEVAVFSRALSPQEISQYYSWAIGTPKRKYIFAPSVPEPNFFPFF